MYTVRIPDAELSFERLDTALAYLAQNYCRCDTESSGAPWAAQDRISPPSIPERNAAVYPQLRLAA